MKTIITLALLLAAVPGHAMLATRVVAATKAGALKSATAYPSANTLVTQQGANIDNPTYAYADDTNYVTQGFGSSSYSDGLAGEIKYTGFGFAIPTGATIKGVVVKLKRYAADPTNTYDYQIKLVKAGSVVGNNKSNYVNWPGSWTEGIYGGQADLWGTTWTPAEVNASDFGMDFGYTWTNLGFNDPNIYVNYVKIIVYYTE